MVNDMGVDPDEWFKKNPLDSMPISREEPLDLAPSDYERPIDNRWAPPKRKAELDSNPRPEEEVADWFAENPDESDQIEKEKTMHEKMYQIATAKYNPFAVGGSENIGGSENMLDK